MMVCGNTNGLPKDTLRCAELIAVRPMIETYPLEEAAEGFAQMMSKKAEFRVVLTALSPSLSLLPLSNASCRVEAVQDRSLSAHPHRTNSPTA
jgi:hypothetical protein